MVIGAGAARRACHAVQTAQASWPDWRGRVQAIGAPLAVSLAGLVGVTAATMLAMSWTHLRGRLIQAQRDEAEAIGA